MYIYLSLNNCYLKHSTKKNIPMVIQKEIYLYEVNKKVMNIQLVKQIEWAET